MTTVSDLPGEAVLPGTAATGPTTRPDPSTAGLIAAEVLDRFEDRLRVVWDRDRIAVDDPAGLARLLCLLIRQQGAASPAAAQVLHETGVRRQWNDTFGRRRAAEVATWLQPHLAGSVLDLLAGDFTLTRALHAAGRGDLVAVERRGAYPTDWSGQPFDVLDFDDLEQLQETSFGTALLCTVLHHEPDPVGLLDQLAGLRCRRWVVVENCLDEDNTEEFHLFVDRFFNECLNRFNVPCVPQHRTVDGWHALLSRYGSVNAGPTKVDVPGIPFPYELLVVTRS